MGVIHPGTFNTAAAHVWNGGTPGTGTQTFKCNLILGDGAQGYQLTAALFSVMTGHWTFSSATVVFDGTNIVTFQCPISVSGQNLSIDAGGTITFSYTAASGLTWTHFGNTSLQYYGEGTWTPSFTGLTVVNGTGSASFSGIYERIGNLVKWQALITVTGTCTTSAAAGGGTTITNLPFSATNPDTCSGADAAMSAPIGVGYVSGLIAKMPAWAANNNNIVISGEFYI